jgi:MoaA/NifB/PqqE/SkfB family radical SAM enzyme
MASDTLQAGVTQRNSRVWRLRRKRKLNTVIFFVTSHCNATCDTCFYWDELNQKGDLSWEEIQKLSRNTQAFTDLWFSGGEPTLRKELPEIIDLFCQNNGVRYINLPTNGLKPARIYEIAEQALRRNPDLELHINIALDGLRESHDFMRGVPGNFEKALESARLLRQLKRYFNLIRGDARDTGLKRVEREKLRRIYASLAEIQWSYADGMFDDKNRLVKWVKKAVYVGTLQFHHRTQFQNQEKPSPWPMRCTAGETSAVIDFDGRIRACELRQPLANLRDFDMNLKVFWETPVRRKEPHQCFIHDSMRYSYKTMFSEIPKNYSLRKAW